MNRATSFLLSLVYGILIFQLSGLTNIANAAASAVKCQDVIPNTPFKYFDTLSYFTTFNGKTYAISKSAIGGTTPEARFFAMDAGITYEYSQGGDDLNSLKYKFNNGVYGAARPVSISNKTTLDFILKRYGRFLGTSGNANSTYINAWKEYGSSAFNMLNGSGLPFSNFQAPPVDTPSPEGVVLGADGWFTTAINGTRTSQIVEFDGEMDCAVKYTDTTTIVPALCTNGQVLVNNVCACPSGKTMVQGVCQIPPQGYNKDLICGQDLNLDGYVDPNEMSNCYTTPQGEFCPVGSLSCTPTNEPPICPEGTVLNTARDMCQVSPTIKCPTGYIWDKSIDKCVTALTCSDGGSFNATTDRCEKLVLNQCPSGYSYDAARDVCAMAVDCGVGAVFVAGRDRCESLPSWDCPTGFIYNSIVAKCEANPYCPSGSSYNTSQNRCETIITNNCPTGYTYDAGLDKCVSTAGCTAPSVLNTVTDRCEEQIGITCPTGYTYDSGADKCYQTPTCTTGGSYDAVNNVCTAAITGGNCPTGYVYDSVLKACTEAPICSGSSYNITRDRCEVAATKTCTTGYILNGSVCEAAPACGTGFAYNTISNRCEKALEVCPTGYTYDAGLDKCVSTAGCTAPSVLNPVTDRCELPAILDCPTGSVYNSNTSRCETNPTCTAGGSYDAGNNVCTAAITGGTCPPGYTYSSVNGFCVANPSCVGGSYNGITDRCESAPSFSCSDPSYTYNATTARCEKNPTCPSGASYNSTYNKCLQQMTPGCSSGYSYNQTRSRCEYQPPTCATGTTYNVVTNKCEWTTNYAATSTLGMSSCSAQGLWIAPYVWMGVSCPGGATGNTIITVNDYWCSNSINTTITANTDLSKPLTVNSIFGDYIQCTTSGCKYYEYDAPYCNGAGAYLAIIQPFSMAVTTKYTCPNGGTLSGATCNVLNQANPTCNGGNFDGINDVCWSNYTSNCPLGMTYDSTIGFCTSTATCSNGLLDAGSDVCFQTPSTGCASGYTLSGNVCVANATCLTPGTLNGTIDLCTTPAVFSCPNGYSFNSSLGLCSALSSCLSGTVLDPTTDKCLATATNICSSGFTLSGNTCFQLLTCPSGGTYNATIDKCDGGVNVCVGSTLDTAADLCFASSTCDSDGMLNTTTDKCQLAYNNTCGPGFVYDAINSVCQKIASCDTGGALDAVKDKCVGSVTAFTCPSGYGYNSTLGMCTTIASCSSSGILNPTLDRCELDNGYTCTPGFNQDTTAQKCFQPPTCPSGGTYNATINKCDGGVNKVCGVIGFSLDLANSICQKSADCGTGSLNPTSDKCEATATANCSGWSWDTTNEACYSSPVCNYGSYNTTTNECRATITRQCGAYIWDATATKCTKTVDCTKDPAYSLNSTIKFDGTLDICVSDVVHDCVTNTTYNGIPIYQCEAVPVCQGAAKYDTATHACFAGNNTCPLGDKYKCMTDNSGVPKCSANVCASSSEITDTTEETKLDDNMLQNDGKRDAAGNCMGQLFIFNGKPSRCRPPGMTVGWINNCCESDTIIPEDMGNNIQTGISTVRTLYDIGTVAYYTYQLSTGAMTMAETGEALYDASAAVIEAMGAAMEAIAAGAEMATAMVDAMMTLASGLMTSPAFIIGIVVMVVMKVLMGKGCDKTDIQTGSGVASKQCHYIGDYCEKKTFIGCIQRAKGYCCFNSKIGRIIHEQGRPQLNAFQPNGNWGSPAAGNCRGFTPEEFSALNFSTIDLSEYFEDVTKDLDSKLQGAKTKAEEQIKQRYDQLK